MAQVRVATIPPVDELLQLGEVVAMLRRIVCASAAIAHVRIERELRLSEPPIREVPSSGKFSFLIRWHLWRLGAMPIIPVPVRQGIERGRDPRKLLAPEAEGREEAGDVVLRCHDPYVFRL